MKYLILMFTMLWLNVASADVLVNIESPSVGSTEQGVGVIRGFALADDEISIVRYSIDNTSWRAMPYGSGRADVGDVYGDKFPNAYNSGFASTQYWGLLDPGMEHSLTVQVMTASGEVGEHTVFFDVTRFTPGGGWEKSVGMEFSEYVVGKEGFTLYNLRVGDVLYKAVTFEWSNATQGFVIKDIQ